MTHCRPVRLVSREEAMSESAVLTTLMSSISIVTAMQATTMVAVALGGPAPVPCSSSPALISGNMTGPASVRVCGRSPTGFERLGLLFPQLDPADLAGQGFRQLVHEFH